MYLEIGNIVKKARVKAGLTQAQLAKKCHISSPLVNRVEAGDIFPSSDKMALMMAAMGHKGHDNAILCGCGSQEYSFRLDRRVKCCSCGTLVGGW